MIVRNQEVYVIIKEKNMVNSGMMICSFFLKKRYTRSNLENICKLNSRYDFINDDGAIISFEDVFGILKSFCKEHCINVNDEKKSKTFSIEKNSISYNDSDTYRAMSFTVISGAYGIESDMTDSNTNEILFHRDIHVADNKKFNVLVFVPKDIGDKAIIKGILIFQTIATYGVKTLTVDRIKAFIKNIGLSIDIRSISVRALIEKLINDDGLHKITLIKDTISLDDSDNMLISSGREEKSFIRPRLQPSWLQKMLAFFEKMDKSGVYEIDGEAYDDIRVHFDLGGRTRTASLSNIDKFSVIEDFPETVYNNGHFKKDELIKYMLETAIAYKTKMVFDTHSED